ncbi:MAG: thioredoxin family protein [Candidatus Staskawiczbacteria bacterium]|nr:thioredoxin family protein [Candidatus Staskawiczbacteria bacterium]
MIKILGMGCPSCATLEKNVKEALKQLNKTDEVVKITDIKEIMGYGIMSVPALVIDEKVLSSGTVLSVDEVKGLLTNNKASENTQKQGGCSCGGNC